MKSSPKKGAGKMIMGRIIEDKLLQIAVHLKQTQAKQARLNK
jgi:hypothetical protein